MVKSNYALLNLNTVYVTQITLSHIRLMSGVKPNETRHITSEVAGHECTKGLTKKGRGRTDERAEAKENWTQRSSLQLSCLVCRLISLRQTLICPDR